MQNDNDEDDDTPTCWAPGCQAPGRGGQARGLCLSHALRTKYWWSQHDASCGKDCPHKPDGRLFDAIGLRLNVFQETGGACMVASTGPCETTICRHHVDDSPQRGTQLTQTETCALKLAERDGMTLQEVADHLGGITRERVRQIETAAIKRLLRGLQARGFAVNDIREVMGVLTGTAA